MEQKYIGTIEIETHFRLPFIQNNGKFISIHHGPCDSWSCQIRNQEMLRFASAWGGIRWLATWAVTCLTSQRRTEQVFSILMYLEMFKRWRYGNTRFSDSPVSDCPSVSAFALWHGKETGAKTFTLVGHILADCWKGVHAGVNSLIVVEPFHWAVWLLFPQIARAIGVLTSNGRGPVVATLGKGVVPWWGDIAERHVGMPFVGAGCHGSYCWCKGGAIPGCHCWVPCWGAIPGCHGRPWWEWHGDMVRLVH